MDSLITASARALAAGDALGALKRVALRGDPPALALRGIAMAQLGEYPRARELLRRAARGFGVHEELARARCVVAGAEVALAMRDLGGAPRVLAAAAATLDAHGDHANAVQARLVAARKLVLLGRLDEARAAMSQVDVLALPPLLASVAGMTCAELALRSLRPSQAREMLQRAHEQATGAGVPALVAEAAQAQALMERPAARLLSGGGEQWLRLDDVASVLSSGVLVMDACRRGLRLEASWLPLARRPILFALALALARAWPGDASREDLIAQAFRTRHPDETHRARLRVEIGRLRLLARSVAHIEASSRGFALRPLGGRDVAVLAPPIDAGQGALEALLSDGAAWSTSALALALGDSQRTIQRALAELQEQGRVRAIGQARARRWLAAPLAGFTTILLLPSSVAPG